jgi:hypothetical protein
VSNPKPLECLVVGAPGAGKTMFALSLIEALGYREVQIFHEDPDGRVTSRTWAVAEAKEKLVGSGTGRTTTRGLQWATVDLPAGIGRGKRPLTIVDSTGLNPEITDSADLRAAEAQTLRLLRRASMVIHLVSAADGGPGPVDHVLNTYCLGLPQGRYLQLASKADLHVRGGQGQVRGRGRRGSGQADQGATDIMAVSSLRRRDLSRVLQRLRRTIADRLNAG